MAPQTAISKAVCYKTKNEQLWEKAVHFLFVATNCFYAGLPTDFCTITPRSEATVQIPERGIRLNGNPRQENQAQAIFCNTLCDY